MTKREEDVLVAVWVLFLIFIAYLIFRPKAQVTVSANPDIMQDCVADDGTHFQWPLSSGACPRVSTAF